MKFSARSINNTLEFDHPNFLKAWLSKHQDKHLDVEIRIQDKGMSRKAMNYYYGVICMACSDGFKSAGYDFDKETCHAWLKSQLLVDQVTLNGEVKLVPLSITQLDTENSIWYLDACCRLILTTFNIDVPRPGEVGIDEGLKF